MLRLLILDNRDSFSHNLRHLFLSSQSCVAEVVPTKDYQVDLLKNYDALILSPGPGLPNDHAQLKTAISDAKDRMPILGVCLGHQAIAEVFGGELDRLDEVYHGIRDQVHVIDKQGLWKDIERVEPVGRYHSFVVNAERMPVALQTTSVDDAGHIMSMRHRTLPIFGVQFHPESYMSNQGLALIINFLEIVQVNAQQKKEGSDYPEQIRVKT